MKIQIFGHKSPDTDSVVSSIALSYLKNKLGFVTVPRVLGDINNETKFVLDYFKIKTPEYLNDVKIRIKDINYERGMYVYEEESINTAFKLMEERSTTAIPLVNNKQYLSGYVSLKELSKYLINFKKDKLDTTLSNINNTLKGEILLNLNDLIKGKVYILDDKNIKENDILIINNNKHLEEAVNSKASLIIINTKKVINDKLFNKAKQNRISIIKTKLDTFDIVNKIYLSNYIKLINTNAEPVTLKEDDYYQDFLLKKHKTNHTNYPVLNKQNKVLGLLRVTGPNDYEKKKVILVDHNSFDQSVEGIEEAEILEIIDHHHLGGVGTTIPINFRSVPVGCTATIIYMMYKEEKIKVPKNIAGILLSAIISDTLLFSSPTTTEKDISVANELASIAKLKIKEYGKEMLKAASSIKDMSINDIVFSDYKSYTINNKKIGISVITTFDFDEIKEKADDIKNYLTNIKKDGYFLNIMFVTDILKQGSYIIFPDENEDYIKDALNLDEINNGMFISNLISRKKQMLPLLIENINLE